jgi:hypothetical protein
MKKLLAVCSFTLLVAGCAHQSTGYGSAGGFAPLFAPECIMDSAYSLGPSYGPGAWDDGLCRNGGRRIHRYSSPESTNAIAQRASVVGHTRHRPDPRVITRPETETGVSSGASSSVAQGSGFAGSGSSAPAPPAPSGSGAGVSFSPSVSSPASRPAPHNN